MSFEALAAWILTVMLATVPPGRARFPEEAKETREAGLERYEAIAQAIARVTLDPRESPLYAGEEGRAKTAALLLALSYHESSWRRDVDYGLGNHAHGGGRYHCVLQVAVDGTTLEGWNERDLVESRELCVRAALHILQRSRGGCREHGPDAWLRLYASGDCTRGRHAIRKRLDTFRTWLAEHPFPREPAPKIIPDEPHARTPPHRQAPPPP
jgi:hypothetical protein